MRSGKLLPWRSAAECIDFTLPCPSIFLSPEQARALGVKRPLAEATLRRIAKGVDRFVLNNPRPFIVRNIHGNTSAGVGAVSAFLTKYRAGNAGSAAGAPFPTVTANGESERPGGNPPLAVVSVHMEQANAGNYQGGGRAVDAPLSTITAKGCQQQLVATSLVKLRGDNIGSEASAPLHTVSAQGFHHAEVRAFLVAYYGNEKDGRDCAEPMGTVVSRERFGLVTVHGTEYAIADIGLRMLTPRELFRAQGFPEHYVIDRGADGRRLPKDAQVRMCGNSVCPPIARALVEANVGEWVWVIEFKKLEQA